MIVIITSKRDGHVEAVSQHFDHAGVPWVRINIEDFSTNVEVELRPAEGTGRLSIKDSAKEIQLEDVRAVWYRKPDPVVIEHFDIGDPAALDYVEAEFNEIILGLYALLDHAYWINNPFRTRVAHRKLLQLKTAAKVGFSVPDTFVTNRLSPALDFARQVKGDLAIKSLGAISVIQDQDKHTMQYGIFTRRISQNEMEEHGEKIAHMPTLFQQFIDKESELRVTCVGEEVFACEIRARAGDVTHDDYRFDTPNLPHTAVDRPDLIERMHAYMDAFGLNFGCFDFIVPKGGAPIFLEMNCNGQWLWVQERTGQKIGEAIAKHLMKHCDISERREGYIMSRYGEKLYWERGPRADDATGPKLAAEDFTVAGKASGQILKGDH